MLAGFFARETFAIASCVRPTEEQESKTSRPVPVVSSEPSSPPEPEQQDDLPLDASSEPPEDIAKQLPYAGMSEEWIELTFLGVPDETGEYDLRVKPKNDFVPGSGYRNVSTTRYSWFSHNNTDVKLFSAYCYNGVVVDITRFLTGTTYWPDPFDYDSAEEYADDAEWWYANQGYANPWAEALDYYDTYGPLEDQAIQ